MNLKDLKDNLEIAKRIKNVKDQEYLLAEAQYNLKLAEIELKIKMEEIEKEKEYGAN